MSSEVPHGTVLFSTRMAPGFALSAISRVAPSKAPISVALPAPLPLVFVGVLTVIRMTSASEMHLATSVVKKRFGSLAGSEISSRGSSNSVPINGVLTRAEESLQSVVALQPSLAIRTISFRPFSWIGKCFDCQLAIRDGSLSTTLTRIDGF